jgi:enoyl-CoA hydratase/carnithine racemase
VTLLVERDGGVALVTLNRPEQRNAVSLEMRGDLARVFCELDADPAIRVVVLTGAGSAFCAGVDLKEGPGASGFSAAMAAEPVVRPFERFAKPVIVAVNGAAVGAGLEIALACDIRLASGTAKFGLTEVRIGSLAGSGGIQRLARAVSPSFAATIVYTGETVDAETALCVGLVSQVVEGQQLLADACDLAQRIAANAPLSLQAAKRALRAAIEPTMENLTLERTLWALLSTTSDREEGRAAFREKRPPHFKGE